MQLVARAALHGARFIRVGNSAGTQFWATKQYQSPGKWTIGRAAVEYLHKEKLVTWAFAQKYMARTRQDRPVEVDFQFLEQQLGELSNG